MLTYPLGHASVADRITFREQLAILAARYPAYQAELLAGLDGIERRAVEDIIRIRGLLAGAPAGDPLQALLRVARSEGGEGFVAYLGRPDGVYVAPVSPDGTLGEAEPYAPWSTWKREQEGGS